MSGGIYISETEMPRRGEYSVAIFIAEDGTVDLWRGTKRDTAAHKAIPVPDHGRLIDADVLEDELGNFCQDNWVYNTLHHAPTVIPASKEASE